MESKFSTRNLFKIFLHGMGSVVDLSHSLYNIYYYPKYHRDDLEAIGGDFKAVGNDIYKSLKKYENFLRKSESNTWAVLELKKKSSHSHSLS